ncbi:hypothetical protein CH380_17230 [Leptospira adleri]|uniref:Uncharacterized protein n=1 Tax=Leptospira adleri TaxID=2023186 RepID=A0A2M9YKB1_9LEPT|nr:hypothetical protein CH380_17230 [Leptospira adleri]PJZ60767.1 hypothetical protein CH376_16675 [Leptospira adleri]
MKSHLRHKQEPKNSPKEKSYPRFPPIGSAERAVINRVCFPGQVSKTFSVRPRPLNQNTLVNYKIIMYLVFKSSIRNSEKFQ